ncbi:uncharacterized protein FRV6_05996 [Fusarium oxysporum]|nr:uncharacterized protein FRV6_05996 [Fusarium oxysporum]
MHKRYN